jgi:hypothetical protein
MLQLDRVLSFAGTNPPGEAQPELNERFALLSSTESDLHGRGKPESDHRLAKPGIYVLLFPSPSFSPKPLFEYRFFAISTKTS